MRQLLLLLVLTLTALPVPAETLTNDDVIALHRAGISADVILQKISTSTASFDTSTTALIALKEAGVPEAVITIMLQAKPTAPPEAPVTPDAVSRDAAVGPRFAAPRVRTLWSGNCKVDLYYNNKEVFVRSATCRKEHTYQWQDITAICFTFWEKHPGKPRQGREAYVPSRKAEIDLYLRNGIIITFGSAFTDWIEDIKKDFEAGYPELIRCDQTYD